jgi:hypothetical protein
MKKLDLIAFVVTVTTFGQSVAISDDGSSRCLCHIRCKIHN